MRLRHALAIPSGVPVTVTNDATEMLPLVADETIKNLSKLSKEASLINSFFLSSAIK